MPKVLVEIHYEVEGKCENPLLWILKHLQQTKGITDGSDWELHDFVIRFKDIKIK